MAEQNSEGSYEAPKAEELDTEHLPTQTSAGAS